MRREAVLVAVPGFVVALVCGILIGRMTTDHEAVDALDAGDPSAVSVADADTGSPTSDPSTPRPFDATAPGSTAPVTPPVAPAHVDADAAVAMAAALDLTRPSDCPLHLRDANLLPNAERAYRGGVHQGIDFLCDEPGHEAVAASDGRVVMAHDGFEDPSTADREAILAGAVSRGSTPPWTLAMLYGSFVVIDHGQVDGVGHVATVYAHFDSIASGIREGVSVTAGQPLGEIGNSGTSFGSDRTREGIHLHWEILVDDVFLAAGLPAPDVTRVYSTLFPG